MLLGWKVSPLSNIQPLLSNILELDMKIYSNYKWEDFGEDIISLVIILLAAAAISGFTLWLYGVMGWL